MNYRITVLFCCVFTSIINQAAYADKEDKSDETIDGQFSKSLTDTNATMEGGPPDSHEAMNNRELKPKLTISSGREKRSYEFLMGLVNNNSKFQVTNVEDDTKRIRKDKVMLSDLGASELLLEMIVKIAAHPGQWEQVHNLLQNIDRDLLASKNIVNELQNSVDKNMSEKPLMTESYKSIEVDKKEENSRDSVFPEEMSAITKEAADFQLMENEPNKADPAQKLTAMHNGDSKYKTRNDTESALKTNNWPFESSSDNKKFEVPFDMKDEAKTTKFPWQMQTKSMKNTYPRNFAYHRVTGNPLYHSNVNKNPKAYIAVSVIAPKPINTRAPSDDLVLENELRELKPWTHNQNLKNMAKIRSRWVIQSDGIKPSFAP